MLMLLQFATRGDETERNDRTRTEQHTVRMVQHSAPDGNPDGMPDCKREGDPDSGPDGDPDGNPQPQLAGEIASTRGRSHGLFHRDGSRLLWLSLKVLLLPYRLIVIT